MKVFFSYKILFLDVLFPLDVKKIIFVDADQVMTWQICIDARHNRTSRNINGIILASFFCRLLGQTLKN